MLHKIGTPQSVTTCSPLFRSKYHRTLKWYVKNLKIQKILFMSNSEAVVGDDVFGFCFRHVMCFLGFSSAIIYGCMFCHIFGFCGALMDKRNIWTKVLTVLYLLRAITGDQCFNRNFMYIFSNWSLAILSNW